MRHTYEEPDFKKNIPASSIFQEREPAPQERKPALKNENKTVLTGMIHGHMTIHYRVRWDSGLLSESDNFLVLLTYTACYECLFMVLEFFVVLVCFSPNRFPIAPTHIGPLSATCVNIRSQ